MIKSKSIKNLPKITEENLTQLEDSYFRNFPISIPTELLTEYKTVIELKKLIKYAKPDRRILNNLLDIAIQRISNNQRFQKNTFIKLIRRHTKTIFIDKEIKEKIFYVFQSLITKVNDETAWSLTVLLKDIELLDEQINWLIKNFEISEHIQNRLLRYPVPNQDISSWAKECIDRKILESRLSELIGLQLNYNPSFKHHYKRALIWGIHYSKLDNLIKEQLLIKRLSSENFEDLINICEKNGFAKVIFELYKDYNLK